jgi:hypothetical protein
VTWTKSEPSPDAWVHSGCHPKSVANGGGNFVAGGDGIISASSRSYPLYWVRRLAPAGNKYDVRSLVYGNGLWVAVGTQQDTNSYASPMVLTSGALAQPNESPSGVTANLASVVFAPSNSDHDDEYVAVGQGGAVVVSSNGAAWTAASAGVNNDLYGVATTPDGGLMAVGSHGSILYSADGLTWTPNVPSVTNTLYGVASSPDGIDVAVGSHGMILITTNFGAGSPRWTQVSFAMSVDLKGVAYGAEQFVAVDGLGGVWASTNGLSWASVTTHVTGQVTPTGLISVSYGEGSFTALDANDDVLTSPDGINWTVWLTQFNGTLPALLRGACFTNDLLLAVGDNGTILSAQLGTHTVDTSASLHGVAYGEGFYVAAGSDGAIYKSADGGNWNAATNCPVINQNLAAVAYGRRIFVCVGDAAQIAWSPDGDNWTALVTTATDADLRGAAFGAGRFVAVGTGGVVITSTDGQDWAVADTPTSQDLDAVTFANGQFVVTSDYPGVSMVSTDGLHWTLGGTGLENQMYGVAGGNGVFVAANSDGDLFTSADGLTWTQQAAADFELTSVTFGNWMFVAAGRYGTILVSLNGMTWMQIEPQTDEWLNGIVAGPGQVVAVGDSGTTVTEGDATLAAAPQDMGWFLIPPPTTYDLNAVVFNGQSFVAAGTGLNSALMSSNGLAWSGGAFGLNETVYGLAWGGGAYVAAADGNSIFTSSDGKNWTPPSGAQLQALNAVTYGNGIFVVAADSGKVFAGRASDVTWTSYSTGLNSDLEAVTWGNGLYVVVSEAGKIATSTNGAKWTIQQSPAEGFGLYGVCYGDGQYVAVGEAGTIVTSADGVAWTMQTNSAVTACTLRSVVWGGNQFMAVGDYGWTVRSADGVHWISASSATVDHLYSVVYANGMFLAVGANGAIEATPRPSAPRLEVALSPQGLELTLLGTAGKTYSIEVSTNLVDWAPLVAIPVGQGPGQFTDATSNPARTRRFYRAVLLP